MDYSLNLSSPWEEVKERIKEAHLDFTDEDLDYRPGQEKELLERVAAKLGKDIEAAKGWVESVAYTKRVAS